MSTNLDVSGRDESFIVMSCTTTREELFVNEKEEKENDEKPHRDKHRRARNGRSCRRHDKPYQHKDHLTTNPKENHD